MQIEISIDEKYKVPKIIIKTDKVTDEVTEVMKKLSEDVPKVITGFKEDCRRNTLLKLELTYVNIRL